MSIKTCYISGPISGLSNENFENFMKAQKKLEKEGYIVINPHEIGKDIYDKWSKIPRPESKVDGQDYDNKRWREFMKKDIEYLITVDCMFILDNWENSRGSRLEILIAQKLGIPIYRASDYSDFEIHFDIKRQDKIPI